MLRFLFVFKNVYSSTNTGMKKRPVESVQIEINGNEMKSYLLRLAELASKASESLKKS